MSRYPLSARLLHWAMAALLLSQLSLGREHGRPGRLDHAGDPAAQAFGVLALLLVLLRLANRLRFNAPPLPHDIPALQRAGAASHWALYALMLALPLTVGDARERGTAAARGRRRAARTDGCRPRPLRCAARAACVAGLRLVGAGRDCGRRAPPRLGAPRRRVRAHGLWPAAGVEAVGPAREADAVRARRDPHP